MGRGGLGRWLGLAGRERPLAGAAARREWATTAALIAALLAYANGGAWLATRREQELAMGVNLAHLAMLGLSLGWAAVERLGLRALGLCSQGWLRSLGWGLVVGLLGALLIRLFFTFPLVSREAVTVPEFRGLSRARLLWLLGGQFLLGSAVFEEVAFRGLLHAKLVRLLGAGRALLAGSAVFAAWHLVITWHNLRRSNLPRPLFPLLYIGALGALFSGGLLFGLLRQATGHLVGSILAHWLMVASIVLAVARPRQGARA